MNSSKNKPPPFKEWTRGIIIDTGPLLIALASYIESGDKNKDRRILDRVTQNDPSMRDAGFRRNFLEWLKAQQKVYTTGHVLAELRKHIPKGLESFFWEATIEFWKDFKVEEVCLRLQEHWQGNPSRDMIGKIGPTDTAMIALATQCELPVLTSDGRTLIPAAREIGVNVFPLADLL